MRRMYSKNELKELILSQEDLLKGALTMYGDESLYVDIPVNLEVEGYTLLNDVEITGDVSGLTPSKCGFNIIELEGTSGTLTEAQLGSIIPWTKVKVSYEGSEYYLPLFSENTATYAFCSSDISYNDTAVNSYSIIKVSVNKSTRAWTLTAQEM